jgi:hypothetical protein
VQLASVKVTVSVPLVNGKKVDGVKLSKGCTGTIGRIDVTQRSADGIKVSTGAHDITVSGGSVICESKAEDVHQDGMQVMGGSNITFQKLHVDCGRPGESLINSNMFINMAGDATTPPSHVICKNCTFGGDAGHTVSIQHSTSSGVTGSTLCPAKYGNLTLAVGADAISPVTSGNTYGNCPGHEATSGDPVAPTMQH